MPRLRSATIKTQRRLRACAATTGATTSRPAQSCLSARTVGARLPPRTPRTRSLFLGPVSFLRQLTRVLDTTRGGSCCSKNDLPSPFASKAQRRNRTSKPGARGRRSKAQMSCACESHRQRATQIRCDFEFGICRCSARGRIRNAVVSSVAEDSGSENRCLPLRRSHVRDARAPGVNNARVAREVGRQHIRAKRHASNHLPASLLAKQTVTFVGRLASTLAGIFDRVSASWRGQFQGQNRDKRVPRKSTRVVYLGFSPR